ncbi:DUF169 domain-containing protein [Geofilum sp. OHC36d9]|uniref:DUF169 domain-containing protein n=1 Tax=Geofilum sp. OHC36d9 TaxID=3458413 RepID=UPI004033F2A6
MNDSTDLLQRLKQHFGSRCTLININGSTSEFLNYPPHQITFCKAVKLSLNVPVRVDKSNLDCAGIRYLLRMDDDHRIVASAIAAVGSRNLNEAVSQVKALPRLKHVQHINLGLTNEMLDDMKPDFFMAYVSVAKATEIFGRLTHADLSSESTCETVLPVCGRVFASGFTNNEAVVSFGTIKSRELGGMVGEEVLVGMPFQKVLALID